VSVTGISVNIEIGLSTRVCIDAVIHDQERLRTKIIYILRCSATVWMMMLPAASREVVTS
jgi:hypothetical protein